MTDSFEKEIGSLLRPMRELGPDILDTTYFLKDTGSFVYTEGYWHPKGRFLGKIINYPCEKGTLAVHGRPYESITKGWEAGRRVHIPHDKQIECHYRVDLSLSLPAEPLLLTEFHYPFNIDAMRGWFCPRRSLEYSMDRYPEVARRVREVSELFGVPLGRLGVTGSLAYGYMDADEDIDLVFFGTPGQNMEVAQQIWKVSYTDPKKRCVEFGKFWPLRFIHDGVIICCFFVYADRSAIPVCRQSASLVREPVTAFGTVTDNTHSLYMPVVMRLGDVYIDGNRVHDIDLIVYDSSLRGEFYNNERIKVTRGRLVRLAGGGTEHEALVVVDAGDIEKERFVKGVPAF
ncbi:MAG: hypothetical protein NT045_04455 [Candidatus Aureabacteria bacterium]|nr:hypothetical protein [Candidatus Auribacterota bacterium]